MERKGFSRKKTELIMQRCQRTLFKDVQFEDSVPCIISGFCHGVDEISALFGILTIEDGTNTLS
jgi:hypothetical protein